VVDFHVIQVVMEVQEVVELTPVQELEQEIHLQLVLLKVILEELVMPQLSLNLELEAVVEPVQLEVQELTLEVETVEMVMEQELQKLEHQQVLLIQLEVQDLIQI